MLINAGQKLGNRTIYNFPWLSFCHTLLFPSVWEFGVLGESGFGICSIVVCVLGFWHLGVVTKCDCGFKNRVQLLVVP